MRCGRLLWSEVTDGDGGGGAPQGLSGQTIGDHFLLGDLIDANAGTQRFEAVDQRTHTSVQVLVVDNIGDPSQVIASIQADVDAVSQNQAGLVLPIAVGQVGDAGVFTVEPAQNGITLRQRLVEEEAILPRVAMRIASEILAPLRDMHEMGLTHLGISPDSVRLVKDDMGVERALLADVGLYHAWAFDQANQRDPSGCRARPEYIAPEIVAGRALTGQTDLYLVGLTVYEMLTGRMTFSSGDFRKTARQHAISRPLSPRIVRRQAQIPRDLDALVMRLLEKTPSRRPSDASAVLSGLVEVGEKDDANRNRTSLNFRSVTSRRPEPEAPESEAAPVAGSTSSGAQEKPETDAPKASADERPQTAPLISVGQVVAVPESTDTPIDAAADQDAEVAESEATTDPVSTDTEDEGLPSVSITSSPEAVSSEVLDPSTATEEVAPLDLDQPLKEGETAASNKPRFKGTETGQWFVESIDELQAAQENLPDYDEFDALPKDRNLFPYVLGILGVFVAVFIYSISGDDADATDESGDAAETVAEAPAEGSSSTPGNEPDALPNTQDTVDRLAPMEAQITAALETPGWSPKADADQGIRQLLTDMRNIEPEARRANAMATKVALKVLEQALAAAQREELEETRLLLKTSSEFGAPDGSQIKTAQAQVYAALGQTGDQAAADDSAVAEGNTPTEAEESSKGTNAEAETKSTEATDSGEGPQPADDAPKAPVVKNKPSADSPKTVVEKPKAPVAQPKPKAPVAQPKPKAPVAKPKAAVSSSGPTVSDLLRNGDRLLKQGNYAGASQAFRDALKINKKAHRAHSGLGTAAFKQSKFSDAVDHHRRAARYNKKSAQYRVNLAKAYIKTQAYKKAQSQLKKALSFKPGYGKAEKLLRIVEKKLGQ